VDHPPAPDAYILLKTDLFEGWLKGIADDRTVARIEYTLVKMADGLFGNWKEIGAGVFESRLAFGPGYRIYYSRIGRHIVLLLGGGDKGSQRQDIVAAQRRWKAIRDDVERLQEGSP
jgi:putative addiction module killer protein